MSVTTAIPVTDVVAQTTFTLPRTTQAYTTAAITINRSGTGGTHPWMNSLTNADSLQVDYQWSADGQAWHDLGNDTFVGGSETIVKNGQAFVVPATSGSIVGIGTPFPAGTLFRVIVNPSTPLTFSGSATIA